MYALRRQIAAPRTHELPRELARQSEAKRNSRLKARQMCVDTNAISEKPPLLGVIGA